MHAVLHIDKAHAAREKWNNVPWTISCPNSSIFRTHGFTVALPTLYFLCSIWNVPVVSLFD